MGFNEGHEAIVKHCLQEKGWVGRRIVREFQRKGWNRRVVHTYTCRDKIQDTGC